MEVRPRFHQLTKGARCTFYEIEVLNDRATIVRRRGTTTAVIGVIHAASGRLQICCLQGAIPSTIGR
jgi:hypothetical protein